MHRVMKLGLCLLAWNFAGMALAAPPTSLQGEIFRIALKIKQTLKDDPRGTGRKLALEKIDGSGEARSSNFGLRIEQELRSELNGFLEADAKLALTGKYFYVSADDPKVKVIRLSLEMLDGDKQIVPITADINDTDQIFQILGLTGGAPQKPNTRFEERNLAAQEARENPTFDVQNRTHVAAKGLPQWSMGVSKKSSFNGTTTSITPQNVKGLAFVPVGVNEYYELEITNHDKFDAVATLTVDGLDVANTFSVDKRPDGNPANWPGYFVSAGKTVVIRGWLHTIDQREKDNVFSFRVVELGQGAASALKGKGGVGVITAQFREACPPGGKLSGRSTSGAGETAKGEGLQEKLEAKPVIIGENVLSTVSIRYNRPE